MFDKSIEMKKVASTIEGNLFHVIYMVFQMKIVSVTSRYELAAAIWDSIVSTFPLKITDIRDWTDHLKIFILHKTDQFLRRLFRAA